MNSASPFAKRSTSQRPTMQGAKLAAQNSKPRRVTAGSAGNSRLGWLAGAVLGALLTALVAPIIFSHNSPPAPVAAPPKVTTELISLPVPSRQVLRGEKLSQIPFTMVKWPKEKLSEAYVDDPGQHGDVIIQRVLPAFSPVPLSALADTSNVVLDSIPLGLRAITVRIDEESAVEGWARPGSFVDVILLKDGGGRVDIASIDGTSAESASAAQVIAQRIRILAAGNGGLDGHRVVTLLVTQEDALRIKAAESRGKITFMLRPQQDEQLLQVSRPAPATAPAPTVVVDPAATPQPQYQNVVKSPDGRYFAYSRSEGLIELKEPPEAVLRRFNASNAAGLAVSGANSPGAKK